MKQIRAGQTKSNGLRILYLSSLNIIKIRRTIRCIKFETYEITATQQGISILARYLKQEITIG
jgi:hypothetical protein